MCVFTVQLQRSYLDGQMVTDGLRAVSHSEIVRVFSIRELE